MRHASGDIEPSLYRYVLRRSLGPQLALTSMILVWTGVSVIPIEMKKRVVNQAIGGQDLGALLTYALALLVAVVLAGALKYAMANYEGIISERILRHFRADLYRRLLRLPPAHLEKVSAAQVASMLLAETDELGTFFGQAFSLPVVAGLTMLSMAGYMALQNPWMALLALHPIQIWLIPKLQRRVNALSRTRVQLARELSDQIQETVERRLHAPGPGAEETAAARFASGLRESYWVRVRTYRVKYLIKGIGNFFAKFGPFALLLFGGWLIIARPGSFDLGSLVAVLAAYERLDEPWQELLDYYQRQEIARVRYRQVIAAFEASDPRVGVPA